MSTVRVAAIVVLVVGAGCGASGDVGDDADDAVDGDVIGPDANPLCQVTITIDPPEPLVGTHPQLRAIATPSMPGVASFQWTVLHDGSSVPFQPAQADTLSQIRFDIATAGIYELRVDVPGCETSDRRVQVIDPGGAFVDLRLRVTPPASLAVPPVDRVQRIYGGGDVLVTTYLDPGNPIQTEVRAGDTPVPAYVRFAPTAMPDAAVETFAAATTGRVRAQLLPQPHSVLIVPTAQTHAPVRIASWNPLLALDLVVATGTPITGSVVGPGGAPIAGATVQLAVDTVPTTYATTATDGSFTVLTSGTAGLVSVTVTPPVSSGLPRLTASSATFDLTAPLEIAVAPTLTLRNVGGVSVTRGAPLATTPVTLVGTIAAAGMIRSGVTPAVPAVGTVRIALTTGPSGALPSALVPAASLAAVIVPPGGRPAVAAFELSAAVPAAIAVPADLAFTTTLRLPDGTTRAAGAELEAVPLGALALAAAQPVRFVASAAGVVTGALAREGHYQLRIRDPRARGAITVVDMVGTAVAPSYALTPASMLAGTLVVAGSDIELDGARIEILCATCTGLDRGQPLASVRSDRGTFRVAVPDPGLAD